MVCIQQDVCSWCADAVYNNCLDSVALLMNFRPHSCYRLRLLFAPAHTWVSFHLGPLNLTAALPAASAVSVGVSKSRPIAHS